MRVWLFRLILCAVPVVFFVVLELGLRLGGFGQSYPLFIKDPGQPGFYLVNPDVIKRYFAKPELAPAVKVESTYFTETKRPDALRIVVQGGSSAAGYPYGLGASLAGMLQQRLQHQYPDRYVEVIQTAMAAVNSYTLLDFSDEILAIKPDLIVIYAGHNEYLGIMGVGSAYANHNRILTLIMLELKDIRIYQVLQRIYLALQPNPPQGDTRTLMAKVAREKNIVVNSPLFHQGLQQFESNMERLLMRYQDAGIPVFLGTIASNLRHHPPFSSSTAEPGMGRLLDDVGVHLAAGVTPQGARQLIEQLTEVMGQQQHALAAYRLGQLEDVVGEYDQAKNWYTKARDWDQLRFRAPSNINEIINQLATRPGVVKVDAEAALSAKSPQAILGRELMLEHLHPNVDGYFWLADSYFKQLLNSLPLVPKSPKITPAEARLQIPVLPAERYTAQVSIERLLADYPFVAKVQPVRKVPINNWHDQLGQDMLEHRITWLQMVQRTLNGYQRENNIAGVATAALLLTDALPNDAKVNYFAGTALIKAQRFGEAIRVLRRSITNSSKNINAYLALAHAHILSGNKREGERLLDQVLLWDPKNKTALLVKQQLAAQN